jgi:hypothetical protein
MEGLKFSNWLVIKFMGKNSSGRDHFECKCICGSIRNVEGQSLIHNKSRSCGCTRRRTKEQIIERKKKYKAEWFQKNKEIIRLRKQGKPTSTEDGRKYNNKYLYNLTEEVYNSMLFNQNGLCKICGTPHIETRIGRLRLDHNHDTGEIRGLLCHNCNLGLGLFKDDKQSLLKAIKYLNGE